MLDSESSTEDALERTLVDPEPPTELDIAAVVDVPHVELDTKAKAAEDFDFATSAVEVPRAEPVTQAERVASVDVLRGFALCGILAMNIVSFAWPDAVYGNPTADPGYSRADMAIWVVQHIIFETKMMTIFSMLFGAGLVLMGDRADAKGAP